MPSLSIQQEIDAYYLADPTHQRAAGILWAALVERHLDLLFDVAFRPDKVVRNELLQPSGPLGGFAVKVRLAYVLGWIGQDVYGDLLQITKVRNRFAHEIEAKDFHDPKIEAALLAMVSYRVLPGMLERAEKRLEQEDSTTNRVAVGVLKDALSDHQMGFRFCIDQMLHHLDKCRENMERNLRDVPGNWLVADPNEGSKKR